MAANDENTSTGTVHDDRAKTCPPRDVAAPLMHPGDNAGHPPVRIHGYGSFADYARGAVGRGR